MSALGKHGSLQGAHQLRKRQEEKNNNVILGDFKRYRIFKQSHMLFRCALMTQYIYIYIYKYIFVMLLRYISCKHPFGVNLSIH